MTTAIGAILMSVFALSAGDAIIKLTSASFPIWQIYVLRSLLGCTRSISIDLQAWTWQLSDQGKHSLGTVAKHFAGSHVGRLLHRTP